ncbi:hypothetical protein [Zoogloea sp.]|uniref:hypothetical protein n=1 Tax=Zoogloea sp. TaxID=49181 RepID=UPI0014156894|nr:MAG: hypothetical protein F9K15_02325 [Zoogloea sp.]
MQEQDLYESLLDAYKAQRNTAKTRGISFDLSFDEWLNVWLSSGRLTERGKGKDRYCMSRINDEGAYEVSNVFIQTFGGNIAEARKREWASGAREHLKGPRSCMH